MQYIMSTSIYMCMELKTSMCVGKTRDCSSRGISGYSLTSIPILKVHIYESIEPNCNIQTLWFFGPYLINDRQVVTCPIDNKFLACVHIEHIQKDIHVKGWKEKINWVGWLACAWPGQEPRKKMQK